MPRTDYVFKVVFVGDPAVGKTSLVAKHITSSFKDDYIPTLGANITSKDYNIAGRRVTLMIWDVASQERYKKLREKYYMGANAVFIVYDVTRPATFENVVAWLQDVKGFIHKKIQTVLIGNKIDLTANVDTRTGKKLANKIGAKFIETSAKTGENVENLFEKVTKNLLAAVVPSLHETQQKRKVEGTLVNVKVAS